MSASRNVRIGEKHHQKSWSRKKQILMPRWWTTSSFLFLLCSRRRLDMLDTSYSLPRQKLGCEPWNLSVSCFLNHSFLTFLRATRHAWGAHLQLRVWNFEAHYLKRNGFIPRWKKMKILSCSHFFWRMCEFWFYYYYYYRQRFQSAFTHRNKISEVRRWERAFWDPVLGFRV